MAWTRSTKKILEYEEYEIKTAVGDPVTFYDGLGTMPIYDAEFDVVATQNGSGDPSPDNIREITGFTEITVSNSGQNALNPQTTTVSWSTEAGTVYTGKVNITNGLLTITHFGIVFDGSTTGKKVTNKGSSGNNFYLDLGSNLFNAPASSWVLGDTLRNAGVMCSHYTIADTSSDDYSFAVYTSSSSKSQPRFILPVASNITSISDMNSYLSTQYNNGTPVTVVLPLVTPTEIKLTPQEIDTLQGTNIISADTGTSHISYITFHIS